MKTLHLTNAYHSASGGIRTFYNALLDAANRRRREVVLVVPGAAPSTTEVGAYGRIHTIQARRAPAFDRRYRLMLPTHYMPFTASPIVRVLAAERPALVEISEKYALPYLAAMLRKNWHRQVVRPTLVGLSCERFDDAMAAYLSRASSARTFTEWYIRHIYGPPFDYHIAVSRYTAAELHAALPDRAPGFIRVCPMGVHADGFGPDRRSTALRERLLRSAGGTAGSRLLFYAGRLSPEKNLELLLDAVERLVAAGDGCDYRLVLAGDGPRRAWLEEQGRTRLGGRVAFAGNLDRPDLAAACASADVFVHPNPREPFGIGPLEAMASGVPVVVPASGGVLEYAHDGNAWLAEPDAASFAAAVRDAQRGDPARVRAARATALAFDWCHVAERYFTLYDELHDQRLRPGDRRTRPRAIGRRLLHMGAV